MVFTAILGFIREIYTLTSCPAENGFTGQEVRASLQQGDRKRGGRGDLTGL